MTKKQEPYAMYQNLPRPEYPFLSGYEFHSDKLLNPHAEQLKIDTDEMIASYTFLSESTRQKYKLMNSGFITARMLPYPGDYQRAAACNRVTLWMLVQDDYYELASQAELELFRQRFERMWLGDEPEPGDNEILRQVSLSRKEMAVLMPDTWIERVIEAFNEYFIYGMGGEAPYKATQRCPPLAEFFLIREYSLAEYPYMLMQEVIHDFPLPDFLAKHPVIKQFQRLTCRIMAWQNDFYSLPKEIGRDSEMMNIVLVLQNEYNMSLEEAYAEAIRISDTDIREFHALFAAMSDFGAYQQQVITYVVYLMAEIQGLQLYYERDAFRYTSDVWPDPEFSSNKEPENGAGRYD
jgi:hypothetical protein